MKKQTKYYLIYSITNNLNHKIYIGKHKTDCLDDNYFGSGKHLRNAQEKYGLENFTKTILFYCANEEEMNLLEKMVVTPEFCAREDVYNIKEGGEGGWDIINNETLEKRKLRQFHSAQSNKDRIAQMTDQEYDEFVEKNRQTTRKWNDDHLGYFAGENNPMYHHQYTQQSLDKMSKSKCGKNNNRYGSKWYYDPNTGESHSFLPSEIIPNGWVRGRKIRK